MLAGGRSTRFGGVDKLAADVGGTPLLHHAVIELARVTDDIVIVIGREAAEPSMPPDVLVRFTRDAVADEGPLAGALAGLEAADRELAVLVGGDMPELSVEVLRELIRFTVAGAVDAVALEDGGRFRPLPVVVRTQRATVTARSLLERGERSLRAWLEALDVQTIDEKTWTRLDPNRRTLRDVDAPSDLDAT